MTFSILAHDPQTGELGGAAATGNLAVGGWVLRSRAGAGAVASQGVSTSTLWRSKAIAELAEGIHPAKIVDDLVQGDAGHDFRQIIILDANGHSAGWTGRKNLPVMAHDADKNLAVAGNWLENEKVLATLKEVFLATPGRLAPRLLTALDAAMKAGSDSRGTLSAALNVVAPDRPPVDLRVDLSDAPVTDLIALYERTGCEEYRNFLSRVPTLDEPEKC